MFLTNEDANRLSRFLSTPLNLFAQYGEFDSTRFAPFKTRQWFLNITNGACVFFENGKCGVYEARPTQCRTYPFWPENVSKDDFKESVKTECPGVDEKPADKATVRRGIQCIVDQTRADNELRKNRI